MTLLILPPNFKVHKNSCLLFPWASSQDNVHTRPPNSANIQRVSPAQGVLFFPSSAGLVWPKEASLRVLLKGAAVGTLEGCLWLPVTVRCSSLQGEPGPQPGSLAFYGSILAALQDTARKQPGARQALSPTSVYLGHRPPATKPLPTARGTGI